MNLNRMIKLYTAIAVISLIGCFCAPDVLLAAVDKTAYWPVEVAEHWNSVYGKVSGISLEDGDSVGMFDAEGNCYGAGLVRGGYYFLSAFKWEERDPAKAEDFTIPGFKDGDAVVFKAYQTSTGGEYVLIPASGTYVYTFQSEHPPARIDLAYKEEEYHPLPPEEPGEPQEPGEEEEEDSRVVGGGVILTSGGEAEESKIAEAEKTTAAEVEEAAEEAKKEEKSKTETYEEYRPSDIIYRDRGEREPSTTARPVERRVLPGQEREEPAYREKGAEEIVVAEAPADKTELIKEEPAKKGLPLFVKISLLILLILVLLVVRKRGQIYFSR